MPKVFYRKWEWYTELMSMVEQFSDHFPDVESTKFVEYEIFKTASARFLVEAEFGFPQTEAAMSTVFGLDRSSTEAQIWKTYWADLGSEEEKRKDGKEFNLPLLPSIDGSLPDVEMGSQDSSVSGSQPMLSNATLTSDKADRDRERAERKQNGNKHGKEKKGLGRTFDDIMASVFIERQAVNSNGVMKPIYYCLGCDNAVRNNTRARNSTHLLGCKRDFTATWEAFKSGTGPSSEAVVAGTAPAPALRTKKRKLEDPAEGRPPIPGITTDLPRALWGGTTLGLSVSNHSTRLYPITQAECMGQSA
ncbi:hypothetical protein B0H11DRAFT_2366713 [Mycena galericulata]|nr:hypothetical protein B0H11DRAFT_2366713 [Mycena galericulata]